MEMYLFGKCILECNKHMQSRFFSAERGQTTRQVVLFFFFFFCLFFPMPARLLAVNKFAAKTSQAI